MPAPVRWDTRWHGPCVAADERGLVTGEPKNRQVVRGEREGAGRRYGRVAVGDPRARAPGLDAVKGLAALAVVGIHAIATGVADLQPRPIVVAGGLLTWSVPVFMAMAAAFAARERPVPAVARRLRRLVPAYAAWTVAYLALAATLGGQAWARVRRQNPLEVALLGGAWYHLYFVPALLQVLVVLPALAWMTSRRTRLWPFLAGSAAVFAAGLLARPESALDTVLASRYGLVWLPFAVVGIAVDRHTLRLPRPGWWLAAGLAFLGWESVVAAGRGSPAAVAYARPSLLVVTGAALTAAARWTRPPRPLVLLGRASLGVYLLHPALLELLELATHLRPYAAWAAVPVTLLTTAVAAMATGAGVRGLRLLRHPHRPGHHPGTLGPWQGDRRWASLRAGNRATTEAGSKAAAEPTSRRGAPARRADETRDLT